MIAPRIPPHLFALLRSGFEAGAEGAPLDPGLLDEVRAALTEADAASTPGPPVVPMLETADGLWALAACFEVGAETDAGVSDDQYLAVMTVLERTVPAA